MTRSQSSRKPGFCGPVIAILTAAAGLGTAQAAEPEKVIFAAENALYGAGHDIDARMVGSMNNSELPYAPIKIRMGCKPTASWMQQHWKHSA